MSISVPYPYQEGATLVLAGYLFIYASTEAIERLLRYPIIQGGRFNLKSADQAGVALGFFTIM